MEDRANKLGPKNKLVRQQIERGEKKVRDEDLRSSSGTSFASEQKKLMWMIKA